MEENKHSHRKKHSHNRSHHQDRRQAVSGSTVSAISARDVPVFGAIRERDHSGELEKIAQNVLGNYADYQSALDKMDMNEQMKDLVGVAESTHSAAASSKPVSISGGGRAPVPSDRVAAAAVVGSKMPSVSSRRDKSKKTHKDASKKPAAVDSSSAAPQLLSSNVSRVKARKVAIREPSLKVVEDADKPSPLPPRERRVKNPPAAPPLAVSSKLALLQPGPCPVLGLSRDVAMADKSLAPELAQNLGSRTKREKKIWKKKNSPPQVKHGSHPAVRPVAPPLPPEQMKPRPEALYLSGRGGASMRVSIPNESGSGPGYQSGSSSGQGHRSENSSGPGYQSGSSSGPGHQSDGPDTGDVQHMLDELLHPPSLSLVTPIPTPKTFTPFVFPTPSSTPQSTSKPLSKTTADRSHCTMIHTQHKLSSLLSTHDDSSQKLGGNGEKFESAPTRLGRSRRTNRRTNSSSSDSSYSSSGSSDSSSTSSTSSGGSSSSSDSDDGATENCKSDGEFSPHKLSDSKMFDYKDEGTRQALEKLQAIMTSSNDAITPLKKTPPRFVSTAEEEANLSPARHQLCSFPTHNPSAFPLASQASQGFQIMLPNGRLAADMSDDAADSGSDYESASDDCNSVCGPAAEESVLVGEGGAAPYSLTSAHQMLGEGGAAPYSQTSTHQLNASSMKVNVDSGTVPPSNSSKQSFHCEQSSYYDGVNSLPLGHTSPSSSSSSSLFIKKRSRKKKRKCDGSDAPFLPSAAVKKPKSSVSYPELLVPVEGVAAAALRTASGNIPVLPLMGVGMAQDVIGGVIQDSAGGVVPDVAGCMVPDVAGGVTTGKLVGSGPALSAVTGSPPASSSSLLVRIPLADVKLVQQQLPKPKATVEPYNVRFSSRATPQRRNTSDSMAAEGEEGRAGAGRDHYPGSTRLRADEYGGSGARDLHPSGRPRSHTGNRWTDREERDRRTYSIVSHSGGGGGGRVGDYGGGRVVGGDYAGVRGDYGGGRGGVGGDYGGGGRGHAWDREQSYRGNTAGEEYWSDTGSGYDGTRIDPQRGVVGGRRMYPSGTVGGSRMDPDYYMQEARRRKKEADKIMVSGLDKAKLYMESVTYFMRHGGAIEEGLGSGSNSSIKRNPYKMYCDTVNMIKYCHAMAVECKPLLVLCLRCQSALHWRMFLIKQPSAAILHKDLQEFFLPSKSKSPFPSGGFSPLPSPASVGSTASTGSGGGGTCGLNDSSSVSVPRHIYSRAAEHLTVSTHVHTCLELWRLSNSCMEQCREFFLHADRKASLTVHYYSSIFQVASWVEDILKSV